MGMPQNIVGMICIDCNIQLTDDNTYLGNRKKGHRICNKCASKRAMQSMRKNRQLHPESIEKARKRSRDWHWKNREYHNQKLREYMRENYLHGKLLSIPKRKRPAEICEICHYGAKYLAYHHWDDARPWLGVWVCSRCHTLAEIIDYLISHKPNYLQSRIEEYISLKEKIEKDS